jgi:aspartyl-tRNA(Asn)/glutamyl-tRNA(Gln) amidotransferase subunit A
MAIDLKQLTIKKAQEHLKNGDFFATELADAYLGEIEKKNGNINAYLEVFADVKEQAAEADKKIAAKENGSLLGIPLAMKDNLLIKGRRASSASKILENYVASYDSTATSKLKDAGVIFLGRANMDEFAMGGSTENSAYGVTKNPHDLSRVAGGSSGGSAAAVAMDGALAALGSDTGGSVRQPAAFCGVVGLKSTYGSISRHGLMAMGSSLDIIGPVTKTVEDAEILFDVLKGLDPLDSTSIDAEALKQKSISYGKAAGSLAKKIGIIPKLLDQGGIDPAVIDNFKQSVQRFKDAGYEIIEIDLPNINYSLAVYYVLMPAEVSSNLARFDGVKYGLHASGGNLLEDYLQTRAQGFGVEARRRIILGTYVLSSGYYDAYYGKANAVRALLGQDFDAAFKQVDAILTPTTPSPAFKIGEKASDPVSMYLSDVFTVTANLVGIPAISIPSGWTDGTASDGKKLPLGIQLMAPHCREDILFSIGKDFEHAL